MKNTTIKNHNIYVEDEAYEYLTEAEANEMLNRIKKHYEMDGYEVTITTEYDRSNEEYNHFIDTSK